MAERTPETIAESSRSGRGRGMKLTFYPEYYGKTVIELDEEVWNEGLKQWEHSVLGYVVGLEPSLHKSKNFAETKWKSFGLKSTHELRKGIFIFKFETREQKDGVMKKGPWSYQGHTLIVKDWDPTMAVEDIVKSLAAM